LFDKTLLNLTDLIEIEDGIKLLNTIVNPVLQNLLTMLSCN